MESSEQNELMTQVGKGTPCGELMRRYWHPVAAAQDLDQQPTKRVKLLGESLVLYKDKSGAYGLIQERCPHRGASFAYGFVTDAGIRCPYHGWEFNASGGCVHQPFERNPAFCEKVRADAYPVEELGGLLFAYLGPEPRPLLPRFDGFIVEGAIRTLGWAVIPCNWLQIVETSLDPVHAEWLHGRYLEYQNEKEGLKTHISSPHIKLDFREFEYGITKHRLLEGQSEDSDDWKVGHPLVFPTLLAVGSATPGRRFYAFQIRVPMDDENTLHFWYNAFIPPEGAEVPPRLLKGIHAHEVIFRDGDRYRTDFIDGQDIMAWLTQGPIADRSVENLGASDQGIAAYRRMLRREIKKVQEGKDPLGLIRDPARNDRVDLPTEKDKKHFRGNFRTFLKRSQVRFSPILEELGEVYES